MTEYELKKLREEIAVVDIEIIRLFAKRLDVAGNIAEVKRKDGLPVKNEAVEKKVIERYRTNAASLGIDQDSAEALARVLITETIRHEDSL